MEGQKKLCISLPLAGGSVRVCSPMTPPACTPALVRMDHLLLPSVFAEIGRHDSERKYDMRTGNTPEVSRTVKINERTNDQHANSKGFIWNRGSPLCGVVESKRKRVNVYFSQS